MEDANLQIKLLKIPENYFTLPFLILILPFLSKCEDSGTRAQSAIACSKLAIETLKQGVKYVQS